MKIEYRAFKNNMSLEEAKEELKIVSNKLKEIKKINKFANKKTYASCLAYSLMNNKTIIGCGHHKFMQFILADSWLKGFIVSKVNYLKLEKAE